MLKLLLEFKELIIGGIVLAILAGGVYSVRSAYKERDEYKAKVVLLQQQIKQKEEIWGKEVLKWNEQVLRQQQELEDVKKKKDAIIKKERQKFDAIFKQTNAVETKVENEIKANVQLRDGVVSVPSDFVRLYNSAVESSRVAAEGGEVQLPQDSPGPVGKSVTYDATTFSEVVIGNALACAALTLRHNTLVDIVKGLEAQHGNTSRTNGEAEKGRGNLPDRVVESLF